MTAYYNEIDPYAAQWLRNLIAAGHIAPGVVDERSIVDVRPSDLFGFTQCHFFAGIGVWSYALRRAGWPDDRPVWTGSCPCQPFSAAGSRSGVDDERHLWPHWHHLIRVCRPPNVFGEQVASKDGLGWLDLVQADLEGEDYALWPVDMCAAGVGAPHIRQRLWLVAPDELADRDRVLHDGRWHLWPRWRPQLADGGAVEFVADDACGGQRVGGCAMGAGDLRHADGGGDAPGGLDHRHDPRLEGHGGGHSATSGWDGAFRPAAASGKSVGLGDANQPVQGEGWVQRGGQLGWPSGDQGASPPLGGAAGILGDAHLQRCSQHTLLRQDQSRRIEGAHSQAAGAGASLQRPGPTNGLWGAADWLFCRDGKWRPVEPGTFPLAHGATSRVGRLRAYGNAIVAEAAQAVIESYLDHEHDLAAPRDGGLIGHNGGPSLDELLG